MNLIFIPSTILKGAMYRYRFGSIVLVPFPFTDLTSTKLRPALIISKDNPRSEDVVVSFITSKIKPQLASYEFMVTAESVNFINTGLKVSSVIRFDKIATLNKKLILGELGFVPPKSLKTLKKRFLSAFGF